MDNPMDVSEVLRLLRGNDVPALVRALRIDLGYTEENAARIFGFNPDSEWGGLVRDVEAGRPPVHPFDTGYVFRGVIASWLIRRGGWRHLHGGSTWRHAGGAWVGGNGTTSWAKIPGVKEMLHDKTGDWGCAGPVLRHDILRLMLRAHQEQERVSGASPTATTPTTSPYTPALLQDRTSVPSSR